MPWAAKQVSALEDPKLLLALHEPSYETVDLITD